MIADAEGLPNITGRGFFRQNILRTETEGAIRGRDSISSIRAIVNAIGTVESAMGILDIDASRCSGVYRTVDHITPNAVACTYWRRFQ